MKYTFMDILEAKIFEETRVMFVTGPYNIFNNMVTDELKSRCRPDVEIEIDDETLSLFGIEKDETSDISNKVDFDTFMEVNSVANVNGKWFCRVDLKSLSKKQKDALNNYIKSPTDNGVLVVTANDYKDYAFYLKSKLIANSKSTNLIQLSWPNKRILEQIVIALFNERKIEINVSSAKFFILRMSNSYDDYEETIDKIAQNVPEGKLEYNDLQEQMKGIENYVIEDFIELLLEPLSNDKTTSKKIYKMMTALMDEFGARKLVSSIIAVARESIEFRQFINDGYIPINIHYSFKEVQKSIGDKSSISKLSEFQFRKKAKLASKTSLLDWQYIILILSNINKFSDESYERALYTLASRSVLSESRLNNDIGVENILMGDIFSINNTKYTDSNI